MLIFKRIEQLMKYFIVIALFFITHVCYSQNFINRAGAANTVIDQRLGAAQNFYLPRLMDTTLSGGLDTMGNLIYDRVRAKLWIRDTVLTGGHKWTQILKTGDIAAAVWGSITGTLSNQTDLQNALNLKFNISDTTNKWVQDVYTRSDSLFRFKNGVETFIDINTLYTGDGRFSGNRHVSGGPNGFSFQLDSSSSISLFSGLEYVSSGIGSFIQMSDSVMNIGSTSTTDFTSITFSPTRIKFLPADGAGIIGDVWTNTGSGYGHWATGGGGGATLNNIGTGFAWAATPGGDIKRVANSNTVVWDSTSTANSLTAKVDTTALKSIYLPLYLNANKTIDQAGNNITFVGGGMVTFDSTQHTITYFSPTLLADSLLTFGNSITVGLNATVQDSAYVNRVAAYYGLPLTNKGVSSTVAYQACASNLAYINPGHSAMVTFCIGLNDYRNNGGGATMYRGVKNAYEAAMVNQFLESYVSASDVAVTRYGSWTINYNAATNSGGKTTTAAYSSTTDDSLTTDITGTSVALGVIGLFGSLKDCIVYIDGVIVDSFSTSAQTANTGTTYQSMGKYYTGLSSGVHHVKVKVGPGSNFLLIDYIGTFVPTASMRPFVYVHVPHMDATGYAGGSATQAIIDAGNDSLTASYNRAFAAGLNVYLAETNTYYNASTSSGLSSDHIHPNDLGMYQIFTSIRVGLSSAVASEGTLRYSNDGHFYGTNTDGTLNQIPYTADLGLQKVLTNGSYLTNPNYISGTNTLDFQGFSRITLNKFKSSGIMATQEGILGVVGINGTIFIGERNASSDTTKGFSLYTDQRKHKLFDNFNNVDVRIRDTSFREIFINNNLNSVLITPTATVHIAGNDLGAVGHAPLKIDSSVLMAIPEKYAIEATADSIYWTNYAGDRIALNRIGSGSATTIYNGDGTLAADRNVASGGFTLRLSGVNNSDTLMSIVNTGTSSIGLYSIGSLFGIDAQSANVGLRTFGTVQGMLSTGDGSYGATIKSNAIAGLLVQSVPATDNTVQEVLRIERGVNGSPGANGVGGSATFYNKRTDNASALSNSIESKFTDAVAATLTSQLNITGINSGTPGTIATFDGNGNVTFGATNALVGTATNNNAVAGNIGEYVESNIASGSAVSLTTATSANVTSISLTAGDWDVVGIVNYSMTGATTANFSSGANSTSATLGGENTFTYTPFASAGLTDQLGNLIPTRRFSLSGTTTIYLVGNATFSVGSASAYGLIRARRVR